MQAVTGTVVNGKIVVEGVALPEGATVTVLAPGAEVVRLPAHLADDLDAAIDEADREMGGVGLEFLEGLKRYG